MSQKKKEKKKKTSKPAKKFPLLIVSARLENEYLPACIVRPNYKVMFKFTKVHN